MSFVHVGGRGREEGDMDGITAPPCGQRAQNTLKAGLMCPETETASQLRCTSFSVCPIMLRFNACRQKAKQSMFLYLLSDFDLMSDFYILIFVAAAAAADYL